MKLSQNNIYQQNFGMSFIRNSERQIGYLRSGFNYGTFANLKYRKALDIADKRCEGHKHFDIILGFDKNDVKIIGKTDKAGQILADNVGEAIVSIKSDCTYPNYAQHIENQLKILENAPEGPQNLLEKCLFKVYSFVEKTAAKIYVATHPYEKLPPNVREGIDLVDKFEKKIQ